MADAHSHSHPIVGFVCTVLSWLTLTITFQDIDIYMRILLSLVGIVSGILGGINWYWSIKKNKKMAKRDIPF